MKKIIHLLFVLVIVHSLSYAQDSTNNKIAPTAKGYYQTIDISAETPCSCDQKTQRTYELAKGLIPNDVLNYSLHAYSFSFGDNVNAASKLFKAFENDPNVYKVSMKEWSSFMLLTFSKFDVASFENAAIQSFAAFAPMKTEDFLKIKNTTSYNEYVQAMEEAKLKQQQPIPTKN